MKILYSIVFIILVLISISCSQSEAIPEKLIGIQMAYTYENDVSFGIKYTEEGVYYQYKNGGAPDKWWGPFAYDYLKTDSGEHFLSWYEPGYGDHVTQLINFDTKTLYGSALLGKNQKTLFEKAKIKSWQIID